MATFSAISTHALADLFKTRLSHDRFWVRANNPTILPAVMWGIVSDYWSDDPRIIDIMIQEQAESFIVPGSHFVNDRLPDAFIFQIDDCGRGFQRMRIQVMSDNNWVWHKDDVGMFTTLLMLPTMEYGSSKFVESQRGYDKDHVEYAHLPLIRDYLYYRLEHPEIPANKPNYSDLLFRGFG